MYKVQWDVKGNEFMHNFCVCNAETAWNLWWALLHTKTDDGLQPIKVKVFDLSGNEVDMHKGFEYLLAFGEKTGTLI